MSLTRLLFSKRFIPKLYYSTQSDEPLQRELYLGNQVVRLVFNAPKQRNALSLEFMSLLHKELQEIDKIEKVRAVILAANGPAFSAGHNLRELVSNLKRMLQLNLDG
jgi:enoyl-CoA hydratase/carnithine racemase